MFSPLTVELTVPLHQPLDLSEPELLEEDALILPLFLDEGEGLDDVVWIRAPERTPTAAVR